jgi:hypothetical protein
MPLSVLEAMKRGGILTEETPEEIARANSAGVAEAKGSGSA